MTDVAIPYLQRRVEELALHEVKRPWEESFKHAAGTGNSTLSDKEPPIRNDVSPMALQENEDEGSSAEEDSDVEEYVPEEDIDSVLADMMLDNYVGEFDGKFFGYCASCVDNEVCISCGNKDGCPADYNPVNCMFCGTTEHTDGSCVTRHIQLGNHL